MHVKLYISRMEMSHGIHFLASKVARIYDYFKKMAKNPFFGKKIQIAYKTKFSVKNAKIV